MITHKLGQSRHIIRLRFKQGGRKGRGGTRIYGNVRKAYPSFTPHGRERKIRWRRERGVYGNVEWKGVWLGLSGEQRTVMEGIKGKGVVGEETMI